MTATVVHDRCCGGLRLGLDDVLGGGGAAVRGCGGDDDGRLAVAAWWARRDGCAGSRAGFVDLCVPLDAFRDDVVVLAVD